MLTLVDVGKVNIEMKTFHRELDDRVYASVKETLCSYPRTSTPLKNKKIKEGRNERKTDAFLFLDVSIGSLLESVDMKLIRLDYIFKLIKP